MRICRPLIYDTRPSGASEPRRFFFVPPHSAGWLDACLRSYRLSTQHLSNPEDVRDGRVFCPGANVLPEFAHRFAVSAARVLREPPSTRKDSELSLLCEAWVLLFG
jgi:hypothetical protein